MSVRPALAALAVVFTAACAADTEPIDAGAVPTVAERSAEVADDAAGPRVDTTVYFLQDDQLVPTARVVADRGDLTLAAADAVRALLAGPTDAELEAGLSTEIPPSTRLLDLRIGDDRIATIDLSGEFQAGGDTTAVQARLGQVACTLDNVVALDIADGTRFRIDGEPVEVSTGQGAVVEGPVSCADYAAGRTSGDPIESCVNGWYTPQPGDALRQAGLDLLRISVGTEDRFVVEDLRYFEGPDGVEHWYAKARLESDPAFRGRFLIQRRGASGGVVAVANPATTGWRSPDWAGFEGEGEPTAYPDIPGRWAGTRFDFVTGTGGPGTDGIRDEVVGCLADT